jgi:hypothetical protein
MEKELNFTYKFKLFFKTQKKKVLNYTCIVFISNPIYFYFDTYLGD